MSSFLSDYLALFINLTLPGFFYLLGVLVLIQAFTEIDIIAIVKEKKNNKFLIYISILVVVFSFIIGLIAHLALQEVKSLFDNEVSKSSKDHVFELTVNLALLQVKALFKLIVDFGDPKSPKGHESFNNVYGVLIMLRHLMLSIVFLFISITCYLIRTNKKLNKKKIRNNKWFFFIMYFLLMAILFFAYKKIQCILIYWSTGKQCSWSIGEQNLWFWIFVVVILVLFLNSLALILFVKSSKKKVMTKKKLQPMDEIFEKVKRAIVKIYKGKRFIGYGTIIERGYILTAAHCVNSSKIVAPLLSDLYCVKIKTKLGYILVNIEAMEVMCDIAVLKGAIHADLLDDFIKYNELIEETVPIEIDHTDKELNKEFEVFIHNKDGSWVPGIAKVHLSTDQPMILVTSSSKINPGASGSPIINLDGQIVGVLSNCTYDGIAPRPHITLPVYIVKQLNLD